MNRKCINIKLFVAAAKNCWFSLSHFDQPGVVIDDVVIIFLRRLHKTSQGRVECEFDLVSLILVPSSSAECSHLKLSHQGFEIIEYRDWYGGGRLWFRFKIMSQELGPVLNGQSEGSARALRNWNLCLKFRARLWSDSIWKDGFDAGLLA